MRIGQSNNHHAAYRETDSSLHDPDKNRLFGSEHYRSGRFIAQPSLWAEGDFEEKMAKLLHWANALNRSVPAFTEAQKLLEGEDSVIGRVIRRTKGLDRNLDFSTEFFRNLLRPPLSPNLQHSRLNEDGT